MGEIVLFLVAVLSVPVINSIVRGMRGELSTDYKINLIWPIIVAIGFAYTNTDDIGSLALDAFGGTLIGGGVVAIAVHWLDERWKDRIDAQREIDKKDEEIAQLRKEIRERED